MMKPTYGGAIDALDAELAQLQAEHLRIQEAVAKARREEYRAPQQYEAEIAKLWPQFALVRARLAAVHARLAGEYAELVALRLDGRISHDR